MSRGKRLEPERRAEIVKALWSKESVTSIRRRLRVGPGTIKRLQEQEKIPHRPCAVRPAPRPPDPDKPGQIKFRPVERYECQGCGKLVEVEPCVICTARTAAGPRQPETHEELTPAETEHDERPGWTGQDTGAIEDE